MTALLHLLVGGAKPRSPNLVGPAAHGLEHTFVRFWPLWLLLVLLASSKAAWHLYRRRRLSKSGIAEIDRMDGHVFEEYLSTLFKQLGYRVELTRRHGDYGADLVVTKSKRRTAVQAKRWSKRVGVKAVQEAVAAIAVYDCDQALVVASREFTQPARKLARANNVELWDRNVLVGKLLAVRGRVTPAEKPEAEPAPVHPGPPSAEAIPVAVSPEAPLWSTDTPVTCVICGVTVSEKVRDYCLEHSTRFGGRIYCFKHQRSVRAVPTSD